MCSTGCFFEQRYLHFSLRFTNEMQRGKSVLSITVAQTGGEFSFNFQREDLSQTE